MARCTIFSAGCGSWLHTPEAFPVQAGWGVRWLGSSLSWMLVPGRLFFGHTQKTQQFSVSRVSAVSIGLLL